jgi:hypothetical protein
MICINEWLWLMSFVIRISENMLDLYKFINKMSEWNFKNLLIFLVIFVTVLSTFTSILITILIVKLVQFFVFIFVFIVINL